MPFRYLLILAAAALSTSVACDRGRHDPVADEPDVVDAWTALPDDFRAFYSRFHADSAYQLEHVTFPLAGRILPDSTGGAPREGRFTRAEWVLHRNVDLDADFAREVEAVDEGLIIETIRSRVGNYLIERRFARVGGDWNLIYYRESGL